MDDMRHDLTSPEAHWSRLMHTSIIQLTTSLLSTTIFRPRSLLVGGFVATITLLATYLLAKLHGYESSGSEPLIGFAIGWMLALVYDGVTALFHKKKY